ncbi:hypothetical protein SE17_32690, partial [Kouleothrix aurantiaca]
DQDGRPHGEPLPSDILDAEYCAMRYRYQIGGEKWGCQRLAATRDFPHERLPNGEYAVEGHVWRAVGKRYRTRYINEILHTFWIHEGQPQQPRRKRQHIPAPALAQRHHAHGRVARELGAQLAGGALTATDAVRVERDLHAYVVAQAQLDLGGVDALAVDWEGAEGRDLVGHLLTSAYAQLEAEVGR